MPANRRRFLIGLGTLAAGGAAVLGTDAFSSVDAERTASIQVAGDASALLELAPAPAGSEYVEITDGTVGIDVDGTSAGAQGVNQNAVTVVDRLIEVTNRGTTEVTVGFIDDLVVERDTTYGSNPTGWAYAGDTDAYIVLWGPYATGIPADDAIEKENLTTTGFTGPGGSGLVSDIYAYEYETEGNRTAAPGESLYIGGTIDTRDDTLAGGPPSELDDTFTLSAEQF
jgi:hypothetical protein